MTPNTADIDACSAAIRGGSKTFFAASLLFPRQTRLAAYAIYAFCRYSDDAIDVAGGSNGALDNLYRRLDLIYAGRPTNHFADRAFASVVSQYDIPAALPLAMLEGFGWDVERRRYDTLEDLETYAARVAGTVGAIMACLMGARSREALARATDLGVAMQLTNIARDVGEDAIAGRLYLPLTMMEERGLDVEEFLAAPKFSMAIGNIVAVLLDRASELYSRGGAGVRLLPADCRGAICAARLIYADIGREIADRGFDSITSRAVVPTMRKASLLVDALFGVSPDGSLANAEPLEANRFLVEKAFLEGRLPVVRKSYDDRIAGVIDLLSRLERSERMGGAGAY